MGVIIEASREVSSPPDFVWGMISNIEIEHEYWAAISSVHTIRINTTVTERKVHVLKGLCSFRETLTLRPNSIHVHITDGPLTGTKSIEVIPIDQLEARICIRWDIQLNRFLRLFSFATSRYIARQNAKALAKMEAGIMKEWIHA